MSLRTNSFRGVTNLAKDFTASKYIRISLCRSNVTNATVERQSHLMGGVLRIVLVLRLNRIISMCHLNREYIARLLSPLEQYRPVLSNGFQTSCRSDYPLQKLKHMLLPFTVRGTNDYQDCRHTTGILVQSTGTLPPSEIPSSKFGGRVTPVPPLLVPDNGGAIVPEAILMPELPNLEAIFRPKPSVIWANVWMTIIDMRCCL